MLFDLDDDDATLAERVYDRLFWGALYVFVGPLVVISELSPWIDKHVLGGIQDDKEGKEATMTKSNELLGFPDKLFSDHLRRYMGMQRAEIARQCGVPDGEAHTIEQENAIAARFLGCDSVELTDDGWWLFKGDLFEAKIHRARLPGGARSNDVQEPQK